MFDFCTPKPLKAYYSLYWFAQLKKCDYEIRSEEHQDNIYMLAGMKDGKAAAMLTYYSEDDDAAEKTVELDFGKWRGFRVYILDHEHDAGLLYEGEALKFTLPVHTCLYISEI